MKTIITADLKSTGMCHYTATKETFWGTYVFTALPKNSPYTKSISKGYIYGKIFLQSPVHLLFQLRCSNFWSCSLNFFFPVYIINNIYFLRFRILRLREAGLLSDGVEWGKWSSSSRCMKVNELKGGNRLSLSLKHLSSPFVILAAGYLLALIVFVSEKIIRFHRALHVVVVWFI